MRVHTGGAQQDGRKGVSERVPVDPVRQARMQRISSLSVDDVPPRRTRALACPLKYPRLDQARIGPTGVLARQKKPRRIVDSRPKEPGRGDHRSEHIVSIGRPARENAVVPPLFQQSVSASPLRGVPIRETVRTSFSPVAGARAWPQAGIGRRKCISVVQILPAILQIPEHVRTRDRL